MEPRVEPAALNSAIIHSGIGEESHIPGRNKIGLISKASWVSESSGDIFWKYIICNYTLGVLNADI